jgi:hypothetical protein
MITLLVATAIVILITVLISLLVIRFLYYGEYLNRRHKELIKPDEDQHETEVVLYRDWAINRRKGVKK